MDERVKVSMLVKNGSERRSRSGFESGAAHRVATMVVFCLWCS